MIGDIRAIRVRSGCTVAGSADDIVEAARVVSSVRGFEAPWVEVFLPAGARFGVRRVWLVR